MGIGKKWSINYNFFKELFCTSSSDFYLVRLGIYTIISQAWSKFLRIVIICVSETLLYVHLIIMDNSKYFYKGKIPCFIT